MVRCKNCGDIIEKQYCPSCGQKIERRLNFRRALDDMLRGITNGDSGVFLTIKELVVRPGMMIAEYLAGRRVVHFRPFPLLILLTGFITIFDDWIEGMSVEYQKAMDTVNKIVPDADSGGTDWFETTPIQATMFIPAFALASWIMFRRKYNFVEHAYITAFATIQRQIIFFIFMSIPSIFFLKSEEPGWFQLIMYIIIGTLVFGYTYWDYKQIFRMSRRSTLWRVAMVFALGGTFIVVLFALGVTLAALSQWVFKYFKELL